jgi:hypothetical protein
MRWIRRQERMRGLTTAGGIDRAPNAGIGTAGKEDLAGDGRDDEGTRAKKDGTNF